MQLASEIMRIDLDITKKKDQWSWFVKLFLISFCLAIGGLKNRGIKRSKIKASSDW